MPPTETDDVTMAVVVSKLEGITGQISDLAKKMEDRPTWQDVRGIERAMEEKMAAKVAVREAVTNSMRADIMRLESWQTWAGRLVGGAVGTAVIGAFFVLKP